MLRLIPSFLILLLCSFNTYTQNAVITFEIGNPSEEIEPEFILVLLNGRGLKEKRFDKKAVYLTQKPGLYKIVLSYTGFRSLSHLVDLKSDTAIICTFYAETSELEQVTVKSTLSDIDRPSMGVERITVKELLKTPILMGELDIQRGLQTLPG